MIPFYKIMKAKKTLTVFIEDIELEVEGWYTPPERADYNYPGAPSEFEIISIYHQGIDITPLLEKIDTIEEIDEEINFKIMHHEPFC